MAGGQAVTGTRDEHHDLISTLYHLLKGASVSEQYLRDAETAGDQELAQLFRDWQDEQRNLAERAKNLLGARMMNAQAGTGRAAPAKGKGKAKGTTADQQVPTREVKGPTNASVKSGGGPGDDPGDEESMESFPASDAPSKY
ncbi:hypothetical protein D7Y13_25405 [Corallococcus praedator]|uniref:Uncharacterized protein n=1 Tax=Corallococcus praedator TaxID=2316724 RepID=A0ABX9QCD7_9BACT|nr:MULTISPECIES: hypothetical protein [Corallococcus]RKH20957.1 hypothetical protein D7X74_02685 [Corallococcus sp. CA047B]RKH25025.1 hypothetical protein D7X75_30825 [Corallococcus sp. CA031C]RKI02135.1 hypothetical protein D7Y13_25405 [Corallococcus praedator]